MWLIYVKEKRRKGTRVHFMHFMFLILAFLLWAVVWGFFHANPKMAGGAAFMIVVAAGGLARNLLIFPLSKRSPI